MAPYGERWKTQRGKTHKALSIDAVRTFTPVQGKIAVDLVISLLEDSDSFLEQLHL